MCLPLVAIKTRELYGFGVRGAVEPLGFGRWNNHVKIACVVKRVLSTTRGLAARPCRSFADSDEVVISVFNPIKVASSGAAFAGFWDDYDFSDETKIQINNVETLQTKSPIFSDQSIRDLAAFSAVLKRIHIRLMSEGYVLKDGKLYRGTVDDSLRVCDSVDDKKKKHGK